MYRKIAFAIILAVAFFFISRTGSAQGYDPYEPYGYGYMTPNDSHPYDSHPYDYSYPNDYDEGYPYGYYYQTPPPWGYYGNHEWRENEEHEHHGGLGHYEEHHERGEHQR